MTKCDTKNISEQMDTMIERVANDGEYVVLQENGKDVAALIPAGDLRLFQRLVLEEEDRIDNQEADTALAEDGFISFEEVKARLGI